MRSAPPPDPSPWRSPAPGRSTPRRSGVILDGVRTIRTRLVLFLLVVVTCVGVGGVYLLDDGPPAAPTFSDVSCKWGRSGRVVVSGLMHVRAGGRHDYYVEPLFRLDNGRLENNDDHFYYSIRQGTDIAWVATVAPDWQGKSITFCSVRGGVITGNPEDD